MNEKDPKFDFEILRSIGRGAYGEVYLARDGHGNYRAVKVIYRESFEDDRPFEREYEGLRKFEVISRSYDNQVQILHVGRRADPEQFFYIMELADDQTTGQSIDPATYEPKTLRSELKRRTRLPPKECVAIGVALTRALESLHENGLIHRDVKPGNIIFVENRPKLADIGLVTDADVSVSHVGTDGFIPPEGPGSPQADIYSLGKVFYEMCTGQDRMSFPAWPTDLYDSPGREMLLELNAVIAKACERDPRKRYRSAREMCNDLLRIQRGLSVRRQRALRRRLAITAIVFCALVVSGFIDYGVFRNLKRPSRTAVSPSPAVPTGSPTPEAPAPPPVVAHSVIFVADDFVVELYHNGQRVSDWDRSVLAEKWGAVSERVAIDVRKGDWLVFNVVNDRMRWDGVYYFAVAGLLDNTNQFGFVSDLQSGNWSVCADPGKVPQFISDRDYLTNSLAQPIDRQWNLGTQLMEQFSGDQWNGEPVWGSGRNRNVWIKVIVQ